ncbi:MAG: site-specific integrase [Thermomicrobiales bacterium]|nr:site-specific integrase [Thermomicrobiales bacterium]
MARGSIQARPSTDGKRTNYRVRWETRGPDGQRKHHSKTFRKKKDAEDYLTDIQKEVNDGTHVTPSKETVAAYLDRWVAASAPGWAEATLGQYRSIIRARIAPEIGEIPLAQLGAITVQTYYAALTARYAPATVRGTHAVLDAALARAVTWRLIARNPADDATLPAIPRPAPTVWTSDESADFLTATKDHRFGPLWRLALDSGMRIGELLALTWRDVDLTTATVTVRRTLTRDANARLKLGEIPKTRASRRSIIIGPASVAALRSYRAKQAQRRLLLGQAWPTHNLVFDRGDGLPMDPNVVRSSFRRALARNSTLPEITLHGLRHTMATLMMAAGVNPKIVQERLGHASIQMTLDRYSHVTITMQSDAAALLDVLLGGDARPKRGHGAS